MTETEFLWYRHQDSGALALQAKSAQPILAQSGWFPLSEDEAAAREQEELDAAIAADRAMSEQADATRIDQEPPTAAEVEPSEPAVADTPAREELPKENG